MSYSYNVVDIDANPIVVNNILINDVIYNNPANGFNNGVKQYVAGQTYQQIDDDIRTEAGEPVIEPLAESIAMPNDPGTPETGGFWYNSTDDRFRYGDPTADTGVREIYGATWKNDIVDPTVTDDLNSGFEVPSRWVNTVTQEEFVCVDNTAGAAVWLRTTYTGRLGNSVTVGKGDDADFSSIKSAIESFITTLNLSAEATGGAGLTIFTTTAAHNLAAGDVVIINGTVNYDGTYKVASIAGASNFVLSVTFVADEGATGTVKVTGTGENLSVSVLVSPGVYNEDPITGYPYIDIVSTSMTIGQVIVIANNANADLFTSLGNVSLQGITFNGANGVGFCGVNNGATFGPTAMFNCSYQNVNIGVKTTGGATSVITGNAITIDYPGERVATVYKVETGSKLLGANVFVTVPSAVIAYYGTDNPIDYVINNDGGEVFLSTLYSDVAENGTSSITQCVVCASNGSVTTLSSSYLRNSNTAVFVTSAGTGTDVNIEASKLDGNTTNFSIQSATGAINVVGVQIDSDKNNVVAGGKLNQIVIDNSQNHIDLQGDLIYSYSGTKSLQLNEFFYHITNTGLLEGPNHAGTGKVTINAGLNVDIAAGDGIISDSSTGETSEVSWTAVTALALTASNTNYVYYDGTNVVKSLTQPNTEQNILLAICITDATDVIYIHDVVHVAGKVGTQLHTYLDDTRKIAWQTGLGASAGTTTTKIDVSGGSYYLGMRELTVAAPGADVAFDYYYGTDGATRVAAQTDIDVTNYDNAGVLTAMTGSYYRADTLYVTSDGNVSIIYGTAEYLLQADAENSTQASPITIIEPSAMAVAKVVVQKTTGIVSFIDIRPDPNASTSSGGGGGGGGVTDHGALTGLADDDHSQYLLADGTRVMGGNLDMGTNNITNAGSITGTSLSAPHMGSHLPGGGDALTTAAPVDVAAANSVGTAASFARSDHVHNHGVQSDPTFHAVATTGAHGFLSSTDKTRLDGIQTAAELNTVSNVGVAGVGLFKQKTVSDFEFKNINAGSTKISITDDLVNNEVDIDVVEANLVLNNISGILATSKGGTGQATALAGFDALAPSGAKGDIIGHDGVNSVQVGVGNNNDVLIADSVQASGVKWGPVSLTNAMVNVAGQLATNSTTYVVPAGGPSFTAPTTGTYMVTFKSSASSSAVTGGTSTYIGDTSIFVNAIQVADSEVKYQREYDSSIVPISTHTIVTLTVGDTVDIRMRVGAGSAGHTFQLDNSNLIYIKIG